MVEEDYFNREIWDLVVPYENYEWIYRMTDEDAYIFCILHLIRHAKFTGMQIRDVLDVYLFCKAYEPVWNREKIEEKLTAFGGKEFEETIRKMAYQWFASENQGDFGEVEKWVIKGTSEENLMYYQIGEKKGKGNYVRRLLFPEYKVIKQRYPILKKAPVLLPVAWGVRILTDIFSKKASLKQRMDTVKWIGTVEKEKVEDIQKVYEKLGIRRKEQ